MLFLKEAAGNKGELDCKSPQGIPPPSSKGEAALSFVTPVLSPVLLLLAEVLLCCVNQYSAANPAKVNRPAQSGPRPSLHFYVLHYNKWAIFIPVSC